MEGIECQKGFFLQIENHIQFLDQKDVHIHDISIFDEVLEVSLDLINYYVFAKERTKFIPKNSFDLQEKKLILLK